MSPNTSSAGLRMRGITKYFGVNAALDRADLEVEKGTIHALVGANGAGKSTLIRILSGYFRPDAGDIELDGNRLDITSPSDSLKAGVVTIYQESHLCMDLSIRENVLLGQLDHRRGLINVETQRAKVAGLLERCGLDVDPEVPVGSLSPGKRQMVQIARALAHDVKVMVFDEPTAVLTHGESERLFAIIRNLSERGISVLYVSHRMPEIFQLCEAVTVLRDGHSVLAAPLATVNQNELIAAMVGRVPPRSEPAAAIDVESKPVLSLHLLSGQGFTEISFVAKAGRVLGLYGLVGSGRSELALCIAGAEGRTGGDIRLNGESVEFKNPNEALDQGIALVPEDRKINGVFLGSSISDNICLPHLRHGLSRGGLVRERAVREQAQDLTDRLRVKMSGIGAEVRSLSGGNQQKVVFARALVRKCQVLIIDEPTQGVDVAGKEEIYTLIRSLQSEGVAILMITSDMPELLRLSDDIVVMREGRLVGALPRTQDEERVMRIASGTESESIL